METNKESRIDVYACEWEIALRIGISAKAVEKNLARMKADGLLTRIGPDKGGHREENK